MNTIKKTLAISAVTLAAAMAMPSFAQSMMDHSKMGMVQTPSMTDGEVRKVDLEAGKITIKHADIKHMDMPAMTMVFKVADPSLLTGLTVNDEVLFSVEKQGSALIVTQIKQQKPTSVE